MIKTMNGFSIMDVFGLKMFGNMFPSSKEHATIPDNKYEKYDLLVQTKKETKYIEIKCLSEVLPSTATHLITKTDWDYLISTPTGTKSLYVLFGDEATVIYDLKAMHHLDYYKILPRKNFKTEMLQGEKEDQLYSVLQYDMAITAGIAKCYPHHGSIEKYGFSIKKLLKDIKDDTISSGDIMGLFKLLNEN